MLSHSHRVAARRLPDGRDLITQQETIELIVETARDGRCAVLLVSHDRDLIDKTADHVISIGDVSGDIAAVA